MGEDLGNAAISNRHGLKLSRIPTAENKSHHLSREMGHDDDHLFREKMLWGPAIE
jgi:hypothetical protein